MTSLCVVVVLSEMPAKYIDKKTTDQGRQHRIEQACLAFAKPFEAAYSQKDCQSFADRQIVRVA